MAEQTSSAFVHIEMTSADPDASRKFYEKVFGWKFREDSMGDASYLSFQTGKDPGGGILKPMKGMPTGTLAYIYVESVEAAAKKITSAGGKILVPKQEVPTVGWFSIFEAPGGVVQAVFEPKPRP